MIGTSGARLAKTLRPPQSAMMSSMRCLPLIGHERLAPHLVEDRHRRRAGVRGAQRGRARARISRGAPVRLGLVAEQHAEPLDRARDVVEPARLELEQADAGGLELLELAAGVAALPDEDEVGLQRDHALDVEPAGVADARRSRAPPAGSR